MEKGRFTVLTIRTLSLKGVTRDKSDTGRHF